MAQVQIEESWKEVLREEFEKPYFKELVAHIKADKAAGKIIYPPGPLIFNAFNTTPFDKVKVVVLGQDPYHNPGEAMGLCFSVPCGVRVPPSLRNIFKELHEDTGVAIPPGGDLTPWAQQGVFLLNAFLTVLKNRPRSHEHIGWQLFTDAVIKKLSDEREHLVFMLWGSFARKKEVLINPERHLILKAAHPSPLARGGFFGSHHFSKANAYLKEHGIVPVNWDLSHNCPS